MTKALLRTYPAKGTICSKVMEAASLNMHETVDVREEGGALPASVALKIQERRQDYFMILNSGLEQASADDPYTAYQVPDDLMWSLKSN